MSRWKTQSAFFILYTFLLLLPAGEALAQAALQSGTPVQFSLPAQNYTSNYYIDVGSGAQQLGSQQAAASFASRNLPSEPSP